MPGEEINPAASGEAPNMNQPQPQPPTIPPIDPQVEIAALKAELNRFKRAGNTLGDKVAALENRDRLPASLKLPPLGKYSGDKREDLLAWLFQVNEHLDLSDIAHDKHKIAFAGTSLTGNAATWYRSIKLEGSVTTWEEFQESIKAHFYPINPVKLARDQLHNLEQTTSVRDYTATFKTLCAIIGPKITEDEKLDRFVRGLKTRTRNQVNLEDPETFEEACRLAEAIDVNNDRIFNRSSHRQANRDGPVPMDLNAMPNSQEKPKFKKLTPEEKERRHREGLCLYCGSKEQKLDSCPLRKPQGKGQPRPNRGA